MIDEPEQVISGAAPGWYLLNVDGLGTAPAASAVLDLQKGSGCERLLLRGDKLGHSADVVFFHPSGGRFVLADSGGGALPTSATIRLRRISRYAAMLRMLCSRAPAGTGGRASVLSTVHALATLALLSGARQAMAWVVARHQSAFQPPSTSTHGKASLRVGFLGPAVAELDPNSQLRWLADDSAGRWETVGPHPRFGLATRGAPLGLRAGWHRLRASFTTHHGNLVAPALYPDYGHGYTDEEMIRLPDPGPSGVIDVLFLLKHDARSLRFDPTIRRAQFAIERFDIARLGRISALVRMLLGTRGDGRSRWRAIASATLTFGMTMARRGLSTAASELFEKQPYRRLPQEGGYLDWVRRYDTLGPLDLGALGQRAHAIVDAPLISMVVPVYRTPEPWLRRCLDSVLSQVYANWELCIADDASPDPHVARVLREYAARDPRIKLCLREVNGHISEASNSALAMATGDFIGLLDHDDELRPHALLEMAEALTAHPDVGLLYSDEDKIDGDGRRFQPNFKPDWNYDLLLSQNYVCHFTVIRADLVRDVGGFRAGLEGSQDHDLVLRCIERLRPAQIRHIPRILYHWRAVEGSTALSRDAKDYAADAGLRAVGDHLQRVGARAVASPLPHGHYRVSWQLADPAPRISIIIPTRDRAALLRACVESILDRTAYDDYEIVVIDNQSSEPEALQYLEELRDRPMVRVLSYGAPFNYSAINNWTASQCDGELLCLLNNDIEVYSSGWLAEMAGHAMRSGVGAVGAMLYYPDRTIQHAGVVLGVGGVANHAFQHQPAGAPGFCARALVTQNLSAVTGACLMVRRALYLEVDGLDERLAVAFNDIDFCLRLRQAGYQNVWTPFAELYHHESASRGIDDTPDKRQRFVSEVELMQSRWGEQLQRDPAYNPNLSLDRECYELAFPPRST
jgi:GT2 family glycosyltransferase